MHWGAGGGALSHPEARALGSGGVKAGCEGREDRFC